MNFVEELRWRGMIQDIMPGTEDLLKKEMTAAYVGIDPTADSLHIGHLVGIMLLKHLQIAGHKPIVLLGGATGMIGDPSGKSEERNLLDEATLRYNQECLQRQISKFLDFSTNVPNAAEMVNNYDWMKNFTFLDFIRDVGKRISVNYMMAKDSVKKRLERDDVGLSFTEFTYQLVQGYDFLHLYRHKNCKLQMGGSDQWGNITTGSELIRKMESGEAYALTCPLITKSDGGKFGKTEKGNVWLDAKLTSPYHFFQFWMNVSDAEAEKYIKIFTLLSQNDIIELVEKHKVAPHERLLQKTLARELTIMVHSEEAYNTAVDASEILFGKSTTEQLRKIDEDTFLSVFEGVPQFHISRTDFQNEIDVVSLLAEKTQVFPSKGELRRLISGGGLAVNQAKIDTPETTVSVNDLMNGKYLLIKKGKKNYSIVKVVGE